MHLEACTADLPSKLSLSCLIDSTKRAVELSLSHPTTMVGSRTELAIATTATAAQVTG